jgi:hypothetical protein
VSLNSDEIVDLIKTKLKSGADPREALWSADEKQLTKEQKEEVKRRKKRRKQKAFTCENSKCSIHSRKCYTLDSDLNAARNILTAIITSPSL